MNSYLKKSQTSSGSSSPKPWMKNLKQKGKSHAQYFAADDPEAQAKARAKAIAEDDDDSSALNYSDEEDGAEGYKGRDRKGGRKSRRGRGRNDDDDEEGRALDKQRQDRDDGDPKRGISPTILNMVDDWSHFEKLGREGNTVDTSEMDDLDAFMSIIYAEAAKTTDGTVWGTMEEGVNAKGKGGKRNKVRIPHPRTTRQLARTTVPQICPQQGGAPGSEGVQLAAEAWKVLAKNPYFTLQEKKDMCNRIARRANWYLDDSQGIYDEDLAEDAQKGANKRRWSKQDIESEMVWTDDWSRGLKGLEEEEELKQRLEEEELLKRSKDYVGQDDTNWDVEAVVDEDDLFK